MCSTSKLVNNFPCNQARQLSGSFFGRCPSPIIDFIRLNASSICQRHRYSCRIAFRFHDRGSVVHRKKYSAASKDSADTVFCCRWRRKRGPVWRAKRGQLRGYALALSGRGSRRAVAARARALLSLGPDWATHRRWALAAWPPLAPRKWPHRSPPLTVQCGLAPYAP